MLPELTVMRWNCPRIYSPTVLI